MEYSTCGACRGERGCKDCQKASGKVTYTGLTMFHEINPSVSCQKELRFLLAADIGTTTLAFLLADQNGTILSAYGRENPQRKVAADVIGRVDAACHGEREILTKMLKEALFQGFLFVLSEGIQACGIYEEREIQIAMAGNTIMEHILLSYPVSGLAKAPFSPFQTEGRLIDFQSLFSAEISEYEKEKRQAPHPLKNSEIFIFPCLSAFVGGDTLAGAYALFQEKKTEMLIDFGTNGEILLSHKNHLIATAAAMGTAFEGGSFAYASDLFQLIAKALKLGILDKTGLLQEPYFTNGFEELSEEDVREFQLAKAAILTGIQILCEKQGIAFSEVETVFLAGGAGQYINTEDLFTTGIFPKEWRGKVKQVGNSCIGGLLTSLCRQECPKSFPGEAVNLAEQEEFEVLYYQNMNF